MFTAGTRLNLFYKTAFTPSAGQQWFTLPNDTTGGNFIEMEIMPSSMDPDSMFNCALYVDHFDGRGAQPFIEAGLAVVMPGAGYNYEQTAWDRWDVEAPSSGQGSVGRPLNTDYGATVVQMLGYKDVKWNSGNLNATNFSQEDANVMIPWLSIVEPGLGFNNFYGSGDGFAESIETEAATAPAAKRFLNDFCGVDLCVRSRRRRGLPHRHPRLGRHLPGPEPGRRQLPVCLRGPSLGSASGPGQRLPAAALLRRAPALRGRRRRASRRRGVLLAAELAGPFSTLRWPTWPPAARTTRPSSTVCRSTIAATPATARSPQAPQTAVEERLREVQSWFGYEGLSGGGPFLCDDATAGTSVPGDLGRTATFKTALANFAPNPLVGGARGTIQFTMARDGAASVEVFDVSGRLVKTVLDGIALEGINTVHWNGTDEAGRSVASGVYFYRLKALDNEFAKKLVIVRN